MSRPSSARLSSIRIYPLKSFEGIEVDTASLQGLGGLLGDREYRLVDELGKVMNAKRLGELIYGTGLAFLDRGRVIEFDGEEGRYWLPDDLNEIAFRFSGHFGEPVRFERNETAGFPDDEDASGPTIISRATLEEVAHWFHWDEDEARRRFRANIEVDDVPAFWEDGLFGEKGEQRILRVGDAELEVVNPCARCAVPSRHPDTGRIEEPGLAKIFAERRRETLPSWVRASRFDHYYRLAVNTRVPASSSGRTITVGDAVELAQ